MSLNPSLLALDAEYTQFNALKTLGDSRDSAFEIQRVGPVTVLRDAHRDGSYYNRILGMSPENIGRLDEALALLDDASSLRVDVGEEDSERFEALLTARGFRPVYRLLWMEGDSKAPATEIATVQLMPEQRPAIRAFLEQSGPIEDNAWDRCEKFHCTDTFRAFAVLEGGAILSLATSFVGKCGVLLGNALTREDARGRGYHSALLAARLNDAARLGYPMVVTDVEPDTASHRNCLRAGFRPLRLQVLWERNTSG